MAELDISVAHFDSTINDLKSVKICNLTLKKHFCTSCIPVQPNSVLQTASFIFLLLFIDYSSNLCTVTRDVTAGTFDYDS